MKNSAATYRLTIRIKYEQAPEIVKQLAQARRSFMYTDSLVASGEVSITTDWVAEIPLAAALKELESWRGKVVSGRGIIFPEDCRLILEGPLRR